MLFVTEMSQCGQYQGDTCRISFITSSSVTLPRLFTIPILRCGDVGDYSSDFGDLGLETAAKFDLMIPTIRCNAERGSRGGGGGSQFSLGRTTEGHVAEHGSNPQTLK